MAQDINLAIDPPRCIFESTSKGSGSRFHFIVPGGKREVVAWLVICSRGRQKDKPKRPCIRISIKDDLLNEDEVKELGLERVPNANYGNADEFQLTIYEDNKEGYNTGLAALIKACRNLKGGQVD